MFESVWRKASKGKKSEKGEGAMDLMVSTCSAQLCIGVWKDLTLRAALVFGWEGREDPAILPLADGIFHLFVTLMAVLWRSFVPEPQRCLENAGPVLVRDVSPQTLFEAEYPFILEAFTYLEINAKATDDFQINITISWNSQKNKHILSVLQGIQ